MARARHRGSQAEGGTTRGARWRRRSDERTRCGEREADSWVPRDRYSRIKNTPKMKIAQKSLKLRKLPGKLMEEEGVIVNNFCDYNLLRFSTDF
jgi:hypothetical protein